LPAVLVAPWGAVMLQSSKQRAKALGIVLFQEN
jgi:hypothetical protein